MDPGPSDARYAQHLTDLFVRCGKALAYEDACIKPRTDGA